MVKNIDIDKIVVSNKVPFGKKGFKYVSGVKDVKKIKPSCIFLPKLLHIEKTLMKLNIFSFW